MMRIEKNDYSKAKLYDISINQMGALLHSKKLRKVTKDQNEGFNCFTIDLCYLDSFLMKLKANITSLPNQTRFQLAVYEHDYGHWNLIDFYIKDSILSSFIVDAAYVGPVVEEESNLLNKHFNNGMQFQLAWLNPKRRVFIQASVSDCQTFTIEHASVVSKMNPDALYRFLKSYSITTTDQRYCLDLDLLNSNPSSIILAPLLRCMQSISNFNKIDRNIRNAIISKNYGSLQNFFDVHTVPGKNKRENIAIRKKDHKYSDELDSMKKDLSIFNTFERSGFGFITFPVLARVRPFLLSYSSKDFCHLIDDVIDCINQAPQYTDSFAFLKIPAKHLERSKITIDKLQKLKIVIAGSHSNHLNAQHFTDAIYQYVRYLDKHKSQRTLKNIKDFFDRLESKMLQDSNHSREVIIA